MSANKLTKQIVDFLNFNGFVAWKVYNGGVYDPKIGKYRNDPTKKKGVFDVNGFRKSDGKHIEIEIKWGKDKVSDDQKRHFKALESAGAICYVARNFNDFVGWFNSDFADKKSDNDLDFDSNFGAEL